MKPMRWRGSSWRWLIWLGPISVATLGGLLIVGLYTNIALVVKFEQELMWLTFGTCFAAMASTFGLGGVYVWVGLTRLKQRDCQHCGYPMKGLSKNPWKRCPECGTPRRENWLDED